MQNQWFYRYLTFGDDINGYFCTQNITSMAKRTHGLSKEKLYGIWYNILFRCYNPKCNMYKHYGGRGIGVCQEWAENFTAFYEWALTNGYKPELSIDRIDVNKGYSPENCRWITMEEQHLNCQNTIWIDYRGMKFPLKKLIEKFGLNTWAVEDYLLKQWTLRQ